MEGYRREIWVPGGNRLGRVQKEQKRLGQKRNTQAPRCPGLRGDPFGLPVPKDLKICKGTPGGFLFATFPWWGLSLGLAGKLLHRAQPFLKAHEFCPKLKWPYLYCNGAFKKSLSFGQELTQYLLLDADIEVDEHEETVKRMFQALECESESDSSESSSVANSDSSDSSEKQKKKKKRTQHKFNDISWLTYYTVTHHLNFAKMCLC